jgi:hypothetical protein
MTEGSTMAEQRASAPSAIADFFKGRRKTVLTFAGFSGAGYEEPERMLALAADALDDADPATTIVNAGATTDGIGAVYELAKARGFETAGVVSTQAIEHDEPISTFVDHVFFVLDKSWGGFLEDGETLSPTSACMVAVSDVMVAIGGGAVARDELLEARRRSKKIVVHAADMNHETARKKAEKRGRPEPTDFRGAATEALAQYQPNWLRLFSR